MWAVLQECARRAASAATCAGLHSFGGTCAGLQSFGSTCTGLCGLGSSCAGMSDNHRANLSTRLPAGLVARPRARSARASCGTRRAEGDSESVPQRSSLRGGLVPTDARPLAAGSASISLLPPLSRMTVKAATAVAIDDDDGSAGGGGSLWARRNGRGGVNGGRYRNEHCLKGLGGPHREHGVPTPMRCSRMLHWWQGNEHDNGEGAAMMAAATRRPSATAAVCSWYQLHLHTVMT